ncbi:MAG TPA: STAS domain-containing protein [Chroococcales cyanobacterium]
MNKEFKYTCEKGGAITVMRVEGFLDAHTAAMLETALDELAEQQCYRVVVDFQKLDYISSAGLGVLMAAITTFRDNHGDLKLAQLPPRIFKVFDLLGFSKLFQIYENEEEAVAAFAAGKAP